VFTVINNGLWAAEVSFKTADNATIVANYQPRGSHAILLAHGAIFDKESWGAFEQKLLEEKFTVLAIDFRGHGKSTKGDKPQALYEDILAGVKFLRNQNIIKQVTVLGASMGGVAAAKANVFSEPSAIDQLILLSPARVSKPEALKGQLLFIASKEEYLAKAIESAYKKAPEPKKMQLFDGKAHAQHIFKTSQAKALTSSILEFLKSSVSFNN
jgi:pimeloyl-ACP methyl ester carboxylesterase